MRIHEVHRPENGKAPQSILAMFQNRSASVVLGDGWHSTEAELCPTLPCSVGVAADDLVALCGAQGSPGKDEADIRAVPSGDHQVVESDAARLV
ncbi:MAG: hypothetical protein ABSH35_17145 [Isosphaeraceae bacterium]|jgi:hypothetical protein